MSMCLRKNVQTKRAVIYSLLSPSLTDLLVPILYKSILKIVSRLQFNCLVMPSNTIQAPIYGVIVQIFQKIITVYIQDFKCISFQCLYLINQYLIRFFIILKPLLFNIFPKLFWQMVGFSFYFTQHIKLVYFILFTIESKTSFYYFLRFNL